MNATTQRTGWTPWVLVLVVSLIAESEGRAKENSISLDRVDVQTLRFLHKMQDNPPILKSLSETGRETLFGDRGLSVHTVVVESDGLWRWRTLHDRDLNIGEKGKATDARLVLKLLTGTSGKVAGTEIEIPETVALGVRQYKVVSEIWIVKQGGPTQIRIDFFRKLILAGEKFWEFRDNPKGIKEANARMIGDLLRQLPEDELRAVLTDLKQETLAMTWIELSKQHEKKSIGQFSEAKLTDEKSLNQILLPSVFDEESNAMFFPTGAKRIDLSADVYALPTEPGKKVWIRVKAGAGPKGPELRTANATKLLGWMKDGTVEMFLQTNDAPLKVTPEHWSRHIGTLERQLTPRK